jgi:uncharacterized protein (TIGR02444 family)
MDNPFWEFSLATYGREGVPPVCLALQDELGVDVNILLYAAWLASMDEQLTSSHLAGLEDRVRPWRRRVVQPLRALRRQLRDYPSAAAVREQVKQLELDTERQQQDSMRHYYGNSQPLSAVEGTLRANLRELVDCLPGRREEAESSLQAFADLLQT